MIPRYRAWNKDTKEMYGANDITAISFEGKSICVQTIYFEKGLPDSRDLDRYDFDDIVLMQSTGLRDKNDIEIFEGDVLEIQGIKMIVKLGSYNYIETSKSGNHTLGVMCDCLGFYVECLNVAAPDKISPFEPETLKAGKIIGNIYTNPELAEVN